LKSATPDGYWLEQALIHVVSPVAHAARHDARDRQLVLLWHVLKLGQQDCVTQFPHVVPFELHDVPPLELPVVVPPEEPVVPVVPLVVPLVVPPPW
jgi:hypothetical protein